MKETSVKVVIVGRSNVGKSTLFNRIIEKPKAIVSQISGTTRDRNIDIASWRDKKFQLIDTGGLDIDLSEETHPEISKNVIKQANSAIESADLILFVVDALAGITTADKEILKQLVKKNLKEKIIYVVNKSESARDNKYDNSLYKLGLEEPNFISASSGSGVGDLLDLILEKLPKTKPNKKEEELPKIKIALLGKPNVGKSSLLNSILGEERVIVSDIAHTTREAHDSEFIYKNHQFTIIDTAGLRRKSRVANKSLEQKSVKKSLNALNECQVAILITEVNKKIDTQDKKITQAILESGKSVVIIANKWDLIKEKETNTIAEYESYYKSQFPYLWWAPIMFISAKEKLRSRKILDLIIEIVKSRNITISDSTLDKFLKSKIKKHKPSRGKGLKNPYIYEIKQIKTNPPRFLIYVNDPKILHFSYIRFLQNNLREKFKIIGTPIQVELKKWKENKKK